MNHLVTFEELNTSTYISAADKLKRKKHTHRAERLMQWANETEGDILYLDPRPFKIDDDFYYVIRVENHLRDSDFSYIAVTLESIRDKIRLTINTSAEFDKIHDDEDYRIYFTHLDKKTEQETDIDDEGGYAKKFKFKTRQEARTFIKIIEDELGEKIKISINDIHKSE